MQKVVGVGYFGHESDIYYFSVGNLKINKDELVVVEGPDNGFDIVKVLEAEKEIDEKSLKTPLKKVLRIANKKDRKQFEEIKKESESIIKKVQELADARGLKMEITGAAKSLDKKRTTIYYRANNRIDFRELVKQDICPIYKNRIDLRQIFVKPTKMKNDIGKCGRECCCSRKGFCVPKIKYNMLTAQGFPSPEPATGNCGRYMCCLAFENEHYQEMKKVLPKKDSKVFYNGEEVTVISTNAILETVKIKISSQDEVRVIECNYQDIVKKCTCGKTNGECGCSKGTPCCQKENEEE